MGTQVGFMLLSLVALYDYGASPKQLGLLSASNYVPFVVLGLFFGAVIDTRNPRSVAVTANTVRLVTIGLMMALYFLGFANIWSLIVVVLIVAIGSSAYDISVQSMVPLVFNRDRITTVNARFELGRSIGSTLGPAIAGAIVGIWGALSALAVLGLTYALGLIGVLSVKTTHTAEGPADRGSSSVKSLVISIGEGFRYLLGRTDILAGICLAAVCNLSNGVLAALAFFQLKDLHGFSSEQTGLVGSIAGLMTIGTALVAGRLARMGSTLACMVTSLICSSGAALVFSIVPTPLGPPIVFFGVILGINYSANQVFNVRMISYRQATVPSQYLARANSASKSLIMVTLPIGSALGGVLASYWSSRVALSSVSIAAILIFLAMAVAARKAPWQDTGLAAQHNDTRNDHAPDADEGDDTWNGFPVQ